MGGLTAGLLITPIDIKPKKPKFKGLGGLGGLKPLSSPIPTWAQEQHRDVNIEVTSL